MAILPQLLSPSLSLYFVWEVWLTKIFQVDHGQYVANEFISLGAAVVDSYYPIDHTHTSPVGANVVAAAFMKGLMCAGNPLGVGHSRNATGGIVGACI